MNVCMYVSNACSARNACNACNVKYSFMYVCMYVRTYVRMYVRTYVRTYVCMCIYKYVLIGIGTCRT